MHGESWEAKFGALKDFEHPFALLTPAMQEGSALGGPFLPLECTLSDVHHRMGLGSICTIGLPLMPTSIEANGRECCYRLYAFPKHWQTELPVKRCYLLPRTPLATMARVATPISESNIPHEWDSMVFHIDRRHGSLAYHIGIKLGTPKGKMPPGWTTHLPGKDGLLCQRYGCHDLTKTQFGSTVAGSDLQNAISTYAHGSHSHNLSPTQSLAPTQPQVRFGSPINLVEVNSADMVRWNLPNIKPDSFQARIVPGIPVEVHGPPVSAQTSHSLHTTLKRRAIDDLYHPGTPKKMKTAAETHLNLEGLDANDTCRLMGHAHKEVLGVATMAGLFNPTHFEVGPSGTIGLTESGLMAVADSKVARGGNTEALQNWTRGKRTLVTDEVRYRMDRGGFWDSGHASLLPLRNLLVEEEEISPGQMLDYILQMDEQIADSLEDLLETVKTLKSRWLEPMTEGMKTAVMRALHALYSHHEIGVPTPDTLLRVNNTLPGRPRLKIAQYLVGIAENYLNMVFFTVGILTNTMPGPVKNSLQLSRFLAQQKRLSSDIQWLLDGYDNKL